MAPFLAGCAFGMAGSAAYRGRRDIAREWRWLLRDLKDWRRELASYFPGVG
jgi:hypothetical protein